jgi:hypothetical protein
MPHMYLASVLHQTPSLSFGRQTAQFDALVTFMGAVSIAIWSVVLLTILVRMGWAAWHRRHDQVPSSENASSG